MTLLSRHVLLVLVGLPLFVFVGMVVLIAVGYRIRLRWTARGEGLPGDDLGPVKAAVFGLLGLLLAFSFSGAIGRFDKRRDLGVQEVVALGSAWDRFDTLPAQAQPPLREGLRRYVASRVETYRLVPDLSAVEAEIGRSRELAQEVWRSAVKACATEEGQAVRVLLLPALQSATDLFVVRIEEAFHHPPLLVWIMLFLLSLASALVSGYGLSSLTRTHWPYLVVFAATTALAVYVILDIEFPRVGLVRLASPDAALAQLLARMQ